MSSKKLDLIYQIIDHASSNPKDVKENDSSNKTKNIEKIQENK